MQLSPEITPTVYRRNRNEEQDRMTVEEFEITDYDMAEAVANEPISVLSEDTFVYYTGIGELIVANGKAFVNNGLYRSREMVLLREQVADAVRELADMGVVEYETA